MALGKHYPSLDKMIIAVAALRRGDGETAAEALDDLIDSDDLDEALEEINESQEENLGETEVSSETEELDDFDESDIDAEIARLQIRKRALLKSKAVASEETDDWDEDDESDESDDTSVTASVAHKVAARHIDTRRVRQNLRSL